jgi:hypothetical protein
MEVAEETRGVFEDRGRGRRKRGLREIDQERGGRQRWRGQLYLHLARECGVVISHSASRFQQAVEGQQLMHRLLYTGRVLGRVFTEFFFLFSNLFICV